MSETDGRLVDGPARVNIEPQVWSDPRFRMVALKTGLDVFSVVARHARLWAECTARNAHELAEDEVDLFAECLGFGAAMVTYKLARRTETGLYLCGTKGRVEWLANMKGQRAAAGRESARKKAEQKAAKEQQEQYGTPAVEDEEATEGQRPVERPMNETATSDERNRTSGSGSGADGSSPTVKTGVTGDLPGLSSSQPDSETEKAASPRARSRRPRVLAYTAPEVYEVLAKAMGGLFVAAMPGGEKIPDGIAIQVNRALKQAGDAGFTLDQIRQVGEHTATWMREKRATQPLSPAWVATTDVNQPGLIRGLTKLAARGGARASPAKPAASAQAYVPVTGAETYRNGEVEI